MFFNKLTYPLIFVVLLVAGLAFIVTPATAAVIPVLSVPDEVEDDTTEPIDQDTIGIQVYGIRAEPVSFELTITFQDNSNPPANTPVTGFDATDIELFAFDANEVPVSNGATADLLFALTLTNSVYTTTITAKGNINNVRYTSARGSCGSCSYPNCKH